MPDFKEMYLALFRETTKVISILQCAQQKNEEMYISDETTNSSIVADLNNQAGEKAQ